MLTAPEHMPDLPMWAAITVTSLCIFGALLALLGSIGLKTLKTMYERLHAPTLASTMGMATIVVAMMIYFSFAEGRLTLKPLLIAIFLTVTTPVTMILLARASIYRDRVEGREGVPKDDM
ncbi:monovalent cation/H(+) antiporter subunit G [Brevundimonas sp.]|uniref:monovalent cation/H(+) antiporter subunit G n=1 Tax=Brevundimonas sp. TaxID=1871086 RepID=UPI00289918E1|nr:monovalent cation/H(+) antiporter subunit G [Brevundimonas sp.]